MVLIRTNTWQFSTNFNNTADDYNSFDLFMAYDDGTALEQVVIDTLG